MMRRSALLLLLLTTLAGGCGSGSDEISLVCTNTGDGVQVCSAPGGPATDIGSGGGRATPTP